MNRPALNSVDEEDSIKYSDGDDYDDKDDGKDVISVFGGVLQVAVKCRELSGIGHSQQSSFIIVYYESWGGQISLWSLDDNDNNGDNDAHPPNNHPA